MAVEALPAELAAADDEPRREAPVSGRGRKLRLAVLFLGAFVFLFPFYYMIIGSLQTDPDTGLAGALPNPSNLTLDNYTQINDQLSLARALFNSGVFTGAVHPRHGRLRAARRLRARGAARSAARARCSRACCWSRSCRSSS